VTAHRHHGVFLNTNVINVLVKHSTHVFDGEPIPPNTEPTFAIDIEAGIDLKAALLERDLGYWPLRSRAAHQQLRDARERACRTDTLRPAADGDHFTTPESIRVALAKHEG
jgi:hypothetical protein